VEDLQIPARDGTNLPARLYAPVSRDEAPAAGLPALLYLHGGGFTVGSVATHDRFAVSSHTWRVAWSCRWTIAWRHSSSFPLHMTMPGMRCSG
jgi:acetyl esterase/lipase